jgi:hypothetical protein
MDSDKSKTPLSTVQIVAGALAAASSAVLLSTVGVTGTVVGAAVGSVVASLATHVYSRGLRAGRARVAAQTQALLQVSQARRELDSVSTKDADQTEAAPAVPGAPADPSSDGDAGAGTGTDTDAVRLEHADHVLDQAEGDLAAAEEQPPLRWKQVAILAAGLFIIVMVAITGFELMTGRAVSSYTGGSSKHTHTTVPGIEEGGGVKHTPSGQATPTGTTSPTSTPTSTPSSTPSAPSPSPSSTPQEPTPSESPTVTPSTPTSDTGLARESPAAG